MTTASAPPCADGMKWVRDLNYDDRNMKAPPALSPGQRFIKGWRVRNSGTCAWDSSYCLIYVQGNVPEAWMGGQPAQVHWRVAPADEIDLQVSLEAPHQPGVYQGFWQMRNGLGQLFGERIWVGIQVPAPAAAAPPPSQAPIPPPSPVSAASIRFWADQHQVMPGERVVLSWDVEGVREVYFYPYGQPWETGGVTGKESREIFPEANCAYELRVVRLDGTVEVRQVQIAVLAAPPDEVMIRRFTVEPQQLRPRECAVLTWEYHGSRVKATRLTANDRILQTDLPSIGQTRDCPDSLGTIVYRLELLTLSEQVRSQEIVVPVTL